jgi:hypothetical protein
MFDKTTSRDIKNWMIITHLAIFGRKIISRHLKFFRLSYQLLDFHGIICFSAVFIIHILNALMQVKNQEISIQKVNLGFLLTDSIKKTQH